MRPLCARFAAFRPPTPIRRDERRFMAVFEPASTGFLWPLIVAVRNRSIPLCITGTFLQSGHPDRGPGTRIGHLTSLEQYLYASSHIGYEQPILTFGNVLWGLSLSLPMGLYELAGLARKSHR